MTEELIAEFLDEVKSNDFSVDFIDGSKVERSSKENYDKELERIKAEEDKEGKSSEIIFEYKYEDSYKNDYENRTEKNGLLYLKEDQKEKIYRAVKEILWNIGKGIFTGNGILNISLPVYIFDKRTLHEVFAYEHRYSPFYLKKAALSPRGIDRLKWITVHLVSMLRVSPIQSKPFNPLIGETYQTKIGDFNLYLEHTVNHPITANFYGFDDEGLYKISGYQITDACLTPKCVYGTRLGKYTITFQDGNTFSIRLPTAKVTGMTIGESTFNYVESMLVFDNDSDLCSFIELNPDEPGYIMSWFKSKATTPDTFRGQIVRGSDVEVDEKYSAHKLKSSPETKASIEGGWVHNLLIDGVEFWNIDDEAMLPMTKPEFLLPSDGSLREDLRLFIEDKEEEAQKAKEKLEKMQRHDRKLRKEYKEKCRRK